MFQIFASPSRYVQGANATASLGLEMKGLGLEGPVLILAGRSARRQLGTAWASTFSQIGVRHDIIPFGGECCRREIATGVKAGAESGARTIVGAGGGKALDTARAIAADLGIQAVNCPTLASTDAPTSALSVIYSEAGVVEEIRFYPRNPALVLVDTSVILNAPRRLLIAGMGDALSTFFEARACARSGAPNCRGGTTTQAALAVAELCWRNLRADGTAALTAMDEQRITPAFERIVETNTLLSGLGFESAGLAAAHAIHNGLTVAPGTHSFFHGEKVAFGTLAQLALEQSPEPEFREVLTFCSSIGLPVTLAEIGLGEMDDSLLRQIAERSVITGESIHHEPFPVSAEAVIQAIRDADAAGRAWRSGSAGQR